MPVYCSKPVNFAYSYRILGGGGRSKVQAKVGLLMGRALKQSSSTRTKNSRD